MSKRTKFFITLGAVFLVVGKKCLSPAKIKERCSGVVDAETENPENRGNLSI